MERVLNWDNYYKKLPEADELQKKYKLTETLKDLFAWDVLTESEVRGLQEYKNKMKDRDADETLDESLITDSLAREYYQKAFFTVDEAFELQRLRTIQE